jgi:hypothetical protein
MKIKTNFATVFNLFEIKLLTEKKLKFLLHENIQIKPNSQKRYKLKRFETA